MAIPTTRIFRDGDATQGTNHSYSALDDLYESSDLTVKVKESGTWVTKSISTHYTVNTSAKTIQFVTGQVPVSGTGNIVIERVTDLDAAKVTFQPGAVIAAKDLNSNQKQTRYAAAELFNSKLDVLNPAIKGTATFDSTVTFAAGQTFDGRDVSADGTKLDGIEANATADQTAAEIKTLIGSASDSNVLTDALKTKLDAIEASADVTDATNVDAAGAVMNSDSDASAMGFVLNEDDFASDADTKVPTQQ